MAVVNERAVIAAFDMLERTVIRLPKVLGGLNFDQQIQKLFANNEQGFFYDPNDLSTMYQDAAGTVPVTSVGQPVGLWLDKSGRNNHAYQTVSASRPILQRNATTGAYYLAFDGVDDFLQTNSINFTSTDKVSLFAGVRKLSDAARSMVSELASSAIIGTFRFEAPNAVSSGNILYSSGGSIPGGGVASIGGFNAPISIVATCKSSIAQDIADLRINGNLVVTGRQDQGTGNYDNHPLYIGRRGGTSLPFNGHIYGLIGIGKLTTDTETAAIEKELAKRTGVDLNV